MYKPTPSLPEGRLLGDEARGDKATRLGINSPTVNMIMLRFIVSYKDLKDFKDFKVVTSLLTKPVPKAINYGSR